MLVGTTRNCIFVGTEDVGFQPIVLGHTDELWGLAAHPSIPQFATAGHDKLLQMWDSMSHSILWSKDIGVSNCDGEAAKRLPFTYSDLVTSQSRSCILSNVVRKQHGIYITKCNNVLSQLRFKRLYYAKWCPKATNVRPSTPNVSVIYEKWTKCVHANCIGFSSKEYKMFAIQIMGVCSGTKQIIKYIERSLTKTITNKINTIYYCVK